MFCHEEEEIFEVVYSHYLKNKRLAIRIKNKINDCSVPISINIPSIELEYNEIILDQFIFCYQSRVLNQIINNLIEPPHRKITLNNEVYDISYVVDNMIALSNISHWRNVE